MFANYLQVMGLGPFHRKLWDLALFIVSGKQPAFFARKYFKPLKTMKIILPLLNLQ